MHSGAYCWMTSLRNLLYIVSYRSFARARSEVTGGGERSGDQRSFGKCTKSNLLSSTRPPRARERAAGPDDAVRSQPECRAG
ncbi:Protein of unknown function [Gryllus bimaculatus]|nr:Protein of unknown function [Gryllus bimaculatus]